MFCLPSFWLMPDKSIILIINCVLLGFAFNGKPQTSLLNHFFRKALLFEGGIKAKRGNIETGQLCNRDEFFMFVTSLLSKPCMLFVSSSLWLLLTPYQTTNLSAGLPIDIILSTCRKRMSPLQLSVCNCPVASVLKPTVRISTVHFFCTLSPS